VDGRPQTNLQLFNELRAAGYPDGDVARIKAAHDFVARCFAGWFRASGKPFISHLIGTAGILGALRARTPVVVAGLSHAIFTQGELPAATARSPRLMRAQVRRELGDEAEDLVARYDALEWNARALPGLRARLPAMAPVDREVVLMRLANELDDHLDLAVLYYPNADGRQGRISSGLRLAGDIAKDLGFLELAGSLDRAFDATLTASVPSALRTSHAASYSVAPASAWRRRSAWLQRISSGAMRRSARFLGREV
jgi:(p)ppGpp synthase/HD superfamily hydrolase